MTHVPERRPAISTACGKQRGSQLSLYQSRKPFKTESPVLQSSGGLYWTLRLGTGEAPTRHQRPASLPPPEGGREQQAVPYGPSHIQQEGTGDEGGRYLPNDGQGSEELAGAAGPPQGFVWLAEADRPQGSAFWAAGPELGRASIKSNRVVCCGWEPCFETKRRGQVLLGYSYSKYPRVNHKYCLPPRKRSPLGGAKRKLSCPPRPPPHKTKSQCSPGSTHTKLYTLCPMPRPPSKALRAFQKDSSFCPGCSLPPERCPHPPTVLPPAASHHPGPSFLGGGPPPPHCQGPRGAVPQEITGTAGPVSSDWMSLTGADPRPSHLRLLAGSLAQSKADDGSGDQH